MMKKTVQALFVLTALFWSTGGAQARDLLQNLGADVFALAGGSTIVDAQYFYSAQRLYHTRFEPDYKYTLGVSVPWGKMLSFETAFTAGPNNLVLTNVDIFPHVGVVYPVNDYVGSLAAVVHGGSVRAPKVHFHFRPYAEAGIEYDRFSPTSAAISYAYNYGWASTSTTNMTHNDKFGMNVGVGLDHRLSKRLTFRVDMRDHITSSPAFGIQRAVTPVSLNYGIYPVKGRANNMVYEAGFIYHLGKF